MKLNPDLHSELENFFRYYYDDDSLKLPQIEIYARRGSKLVTKLLAVHGVTFGRHVFVRPRLTKRNKSDRLCVSKMLLAHEATHVLQYQREGFFRFLTAYFKDYYRGMRRKKKWNSTAHFQAYFELPHEVEARDAAARFIEWYYLQKD